MKILIDIGHPAHVHLFKNFAQEMIKNGNEVLFTCREKEFEIFLLNKYGFCFSSFGKKYKTNVTKLYGLVKFDIKEFLRGLKFKPDIFLSHGSIYAAHASFLLRKPHISFEDTGNWEQVKLYLPFTSCILTSDVFPYDYGNKQIRIKSHHEIAYLHPKRFKPDEAFRKEIGLDLKDEFVILRFVAWNATHDSGQYGISERNKIQLIEKLSEQYKVMISTEYSLPSKLEKYRITFEPHKIHDALYHARMFIGEGTTMAMEAAILGTPSVYINTLQYSNVEDMERYGLLYNLKNSKDSVKKILDLIMEKDLKINSSNKKHVMLSNKIELTAFMVWFVENWPDSFGIMKENPDYQKRFK